MFGVKDMTDTQAKTVDLLMNNGWTLANVYNDGIVNMSRRINDQDVMVFVNTDGLASLPRTNETMLAQADLYDLEKEAEYQLFGRGSFTRPIPIKGGW